MATRVTLNMKTFQKDVTAAVFGHHKLNSAVDRHLKNRYEPKVVEVVEEKLGTALTNLSTIYEEGIDGANEEYHGRLKLWGGRHSGMLDVLVQWPALGETYQENKEGSPGDGMFMLYKGGLARYMNRHVKVPKVSATSHITSETRKTKGARKDIRFRIDVRVGTMRSPLDELVRRPLILGSKAEDPSWIDGLPAVVRKKQRVVSGWASLIFFLEKGTYGPYPAEARPFVRAMALKLNALMRSEIYALK